MQKELAATTQKESALSQALATVRGKVEQAKQAGKESQSQTAIHAALLEGSRSKILTGFCGKLGDLGSIDAKYDVAVSTACPQLNYYPVRRWKPRRKLRRLLPDYLRTKCVGVATFLILEKQRHLARRDGGRVQG